LAKIGVQASYARSGEERLIYDPLPSLGTRRPHDRSGWQPARALPGRPQFHSDRTHVVEEPGDGSQSRVGADDPEIGATHHRRTFLRCQIPGEADTVMVALDIAGPAEPMSREALLHACDHRIDAVTPFALKHGIEIARAFRPRPCDQVVPPSGVGLVPRRDLAIDQVGECVHRWTPCCRTGGGALGNLRTPTALVDYIGGNWNGLRMGGMVAP
jgi:hypothetical protein